MVAELIFRFAMIAIMLIFGVRLGFIGLLSHYEVDSGALIGAAACAVFVLILGPFWPDRHNVKTVNNFFGRFPTSSTFAGYLLLTFAGFFLVYATFTNLISMRWYRTQGVIYKLVGSMGEVALWAAFGFMGLVSCLNALKKNPDNHNNKGAKLIKIHCGCLYA